MKITGLTDEQLDSIVHHLTVAAERYDESAKSMRAGADEATASRFQLVPGTSHADTERGYIRLAEQFDLQAAQARELAILIENREDA